MNKYSYDINAWLIKHNLNERSSITNCSKLNLDSSTLLRSNKINSDYQTEMTKLDSNGVLYFFYTETTPIQS